MDKKAKELLEFGILNLDKPSGPTSFGVSDFVKKKLKLRKTSHFGTLDPKVTGVLPVALNRACKLTGFFLGNDKEYVGIMRLHKDIELEKIEEKIKDKFLGKIKQTPPVKSRVKRQEREREIYSFELLEKNKLDIVFRARVQGGTYIRKLIDDLGSELGVGAHMLELRRTNAGIFSENDKSFVDLYALEKAIDKEELKKIIVPAEKAIKDKFQCIEVSEKSKKRLYTGKAILREDVKSDKDISEGTIVGAFCSKKFIGMYRVIHEGIKFAKPEFVLQPVRGKKNA